MYLHIILSYIIARLWYNLPTSRSFQISTAATFVFEMFKLQTRTQCHYVTCSRDIFYKSRVVAYLWWFSSSLLLALYTYIYDIVLYIFMIFFSGGVEGLWLVGGRYRYVLVYYTVYNCVWRELGVSWYRQVAGGVLYFSLPRPKSYFYRHWLPAGGLSVALVSVLLRNYNVIEKKKKHNCSLSIIYNVKNHIRYSFRI